MTIWWNNIPFKISLIISFGSSFRELSDVTTTKSASRETNGYYFTRGEMVQEYEDAAFALAVDEVSEVVETSSGYYIIQRLAPDTAYVMSHLTELIQQYQYAMLYNMIDEKQAELSLTLNDYGKTLDLTTLK